MSDYTSKDKRLSQKISETQHRQEEIKAKSLAESLGLPYIDLNKSPVSSDELATVPKSTARKGNLAIINKSGTKIYVATLNPSDKKTQEILGKLKKKGYETHLFITSQRSLERAWREYKSISISQSQQTLRDYFIIPEKDLQDVKKSFQTIKDLKDNIKSLSASELMTTLFGGAIKMNASDIHIEPEADDVRIRYRVDGMLQNIATISNKSYEALLLRIKTLSRLLLNAHNISQDGRFTIKIKDQEETKKSIDMRVSVLPSNYGESIVMRLLGLSASKFTLEELGVQQVFLDLFKTQISKPHGMILTTGPTGSGKTTTLYACLRFAKNPNVKIITVENPIEYKIPGVTQTQINEAKGYSFAKSLEAIVRQDPDILMVGEIRNEKSAVIANNFALTGHIVFSTLHTNEASGAVPRLLNMGVDAPSLASSLSLVIAQRLVRKLCPSCKKEYKPDKEIAQKIETVLSKISKKSKLEVPSKVERLYQAEGCPECHGLGYKGRLGVFEFLLVDEKIKELVEDGAAAFEISRAAKRAGMVGFGQDAILKAIEGRTDIKEVIRVIGPLKTIE